MITAQLTDLIEAIGMLKEAKSAGLSMWEAIIIILFVVIYFSLFNILGPFCVFI